MSGGPIFLKSKSREYTYANLESFAAHFGSYLAQKGIKKNKPIGILSSTSDETILIIAACWLLGIPFICFNKKEKKKLLDEQIETLDPALILTDETRIEPPSYFASINELPLVKWVN